MSYITEIGWQALTYPPFWEGANDITLGGQQVTPDCLYLLVWQTGKRTGGLGRLAIFDTTALTWTTTTFPAAAQPWSWSIIVPNIGAAGSNVAFMDGLTLAVNYAYIGGGSGGVTTQPVNDFDMVNNASPFGAGYGMSLSGTTGYALISLAGEPKTVYGVYGSFLYQNANGLINFQHGQKYKSLYMIGDEGIGANSAVGSVIPGTIGGPFGNPAQRWLPGRLYQYTLGSGQAPISYCSDLSAWRVKTPFGGTGVIDSAYWKPGTVYFSTKNYKLPISVFNPLPQNACVVPNTGFEQVITDLSFFSGSVFLNVDGRSMVKPFIDGSDRLAGVQHTAFNVGSSILGLTIDVQSPPGFTSANWSIWEMTGTTFILDDLGNFFRLVSIYQAFNNLPVANWRRMIQQGTTP